MKCLLVNLDYAVAAELRPLLLGDAGFKQVEDIYTIYGCRNGNIDFAKYADFDYYIVEPAKRFEIDKIMLADIIRNKKNDAQIVIFTALDDIEPTDDKTFAEMGIGKVIRMPICSWAGFKEILEK